MQFCVYLQLDFNVAEIMVGNTPTLSAMSDGVYYDQGNIAIVVQCNEGTDVRCHLSLYSRTVAIAQSLKIARTV